MSNVDQQRMDALEARLAKLENVVLKFSDIVDDALIDVMGLCNDVDQRDRREDFDFIRDKLRRAMNELVRG